MNPIANIKHKSINASDLILRSFTFLRVMRTAPEVFQMLAPYGFTPKVYEEGWSLLFKVASLGPVADTRGGDAMAALSTLDAWDERGFERARIALHRRHQEQEAFLFDNLAPTNGPQAVVGMKIFLDRLDALESSPDRIATHAADLDALELLASRGIDKAERARLRQLVDVATSAETAAAMLDVNAAPSEDDLVALAGWYEEWASTARLMIPRRDVLFRLGLVKRRRARSNSDDNEAVAAPVAPVPVAIPAPVVPSAPVAAVGTNGSNGSLAPMPFGVPVA